MNIQKTNSVVKTFIFFLLVMAFGIFAMIMALYVDRFISRYGQNQNPTVSTSPIQSFKASYIVNSLDVKAAKESTCFFFPFPPSQQSTIE